MKAPVIAALLSLALSAPAHAATYVYVSNAEDGDIGMYTLQADTLKPGERFGRQSGDADGGEPGQALPHRGRSLQAFHGVQLLDRQEHGALKQVGTGPLAESFPYISLDKSGRFLLVRLLRRGPGRQPGRRERRVGEPLQVIPTARNAHSIRTDNTNPRFSCRTSAPTRCSSSGSTRRAGGSRRTRRRWCSSRRQRSAPLVMSSDNRFVYLLNELTGTVTTLALDAKAGTLKELNSVSFLPPDTKLVPGVPRGAVDARHRRRAT